MTDYLTKLLEAYWLRPETALWRAVECDLMRKELPFGSGIEFGCGNGVTSQIMANGRYSFMYGVDHQQKMIDEAGKLDFYDFLWTLDLNNRLPFANQSFNWGFSNMLYWLKDVKGVLKEWNRVLKKSSRLYLFVPNANFKKRAWLYYQAPHKGQKAYLNYFDRGYQGLIHHCYSQAKWQSIFKEAGFRTDFHKSYLSKTVMEIWNIGTRPLELLLKDMAVHLSDAERERAKTNWVKFFRDFFQPILRKELTQKQDGAFHFFKLTKV